MLMPVTAISAPTVAPGGAGAETVNVTWFSATSATLNLVAIDADGNETNVGSTAFNTGAFSAGTTTVTFDDNTIASLPPGNYTFRVDADGVVFDLRGPASGETFICFLEGTRIRTPQGDVAVESLRPGDLVLTADGRHEPVLFVGRQTIAPYFGTPEARNPILIRAGALAEGVPASDLKVSPYHGMVVDGVLCFAQALVNGTSIVQVPAPTGTFAYYNVELAAHEVILAEGAPTESFCDNVPRERFDNHAEFVALFPEGREVGEMDLPHAKSRRQVPTAVRARLDARARDLAGLPEQAAA
jgi:hypothetical protein